MNFQKKENISFEAVFSAESGMPQFEGFYLQIGRGFPFYLAVFLAENFSDTQRTAYKTYSNVTQDIRSTLWAR